MVYNCKYCNKTYKTKRGLDNHICQIKERYDRINEHNLMSIWLIYKTIYNVKVNTDTEKEKIELIRSPLYKLFNKFSIWCEDMNVFDIYSYIQYLKRFNIPLNLWDSDKFYKKFLEEYLRTEKLANACDRTISTLNNLGLTLQTISQNRLFLLLLSGQISVKYLDSVQYPYKKVLDSGQLKELGLL